MQATSAFLGHAADSAVTRRQCLSLQLVPAAAQGSRRWWDQNFSFGCSNALLPRLLPWLPEMLATLTALPAT